jgi:DNA polymerase-3 subunit gamma/tau
MSYTVIARKWRPQTFVELIGQEHVAKTLQNAIANDRIAHGYIFTGSRGVGKTSAARIFAKALNCPTHNQGEPCNTCPSCDEIAAGRSMDVIEIDGASNNSVDNIRDLRDNVRFAPTSGRFKIYIIDEVHMLSKGAFNALLKTLEEPPKHAIFIFATTEIHKVLPTILSRCQRFDFKRIPIQPMMDRLAYICEQENISVSSDALLQIAKKADGGMRDSQSILDQLISFCGNNITLADVNASLGFIDQDIFFQMVDAFVEKNMGRVLEMVTETFQRGLDLNEIVFGLEDHFRHLLVCIALNNTSLIDTIESDKTRFFEQSKHFNETDILRMVEILQTAERSIKSGQNPKLKLELALAKICNLDRSVQLTELLGLAEKKKPKLNVSAEIVAERHEKPAIEAASPPKRDATQAPEKPTNSIENAVNLYRAKSLEADVIQHNQTVEIKPNPPSEKEIPKPQALPDGTSNPLEKAWQQLTNKFKSTKPALHNCLYQSRFKSVKDKKITILLDDSQNGRLLANMLQNSMAFIETSFSHLVGETYKIEIEHGNFETLGIEIEFHDIESVIDRQRKANPLFNQLIETFDLKVSPNDT